MHKLVSVSGLVVLLCMATLALTTSTASADEPTFTCLQVTRTETLVIIYTPGSLSAQQAAALMQEGYRCKPELPQPLAPTFRCTIPFVGGTFLFTDLPPQWLGEVRLEGATCDPNS